MGTITKVTAGGGTHYIASTAYCYCDTAASTVAKVAKVIGDQEDSATTAEFTLVKGTTIHVKFVYSNTASSPTLAVGGTAAKSIKKYGTTAIGNTAATSWNAGSVVELTYDGTNWVINNVLVVDSSISSTSTNPLQNKVIYSNLLNGNTTFSLMHFKGEMTGTPDSTTGYHGDLRYRIVNGNKILYAGLNLGGTFGWIQITDGVDTAVSDSSTNAIQNKIIKAYVDDQISSAGVGHRPIQLNGTEILGNNNTPLNLIPGNNINITNSSGDVTISASVGNVAALSYTEVLTWS